MAFSTQRVVSDGSLVLLTIDIDYFERDEIAVFFDGILDALPWAWVGSTERKISFTPAVPNGVEVLIRRSTKLDTVLHEFQLGAAFTEDSVDENFAQILRIAQEAVEGGSIGDIFNDLDMHGYRIKNIGTATDPSDVVTLAQFSVHDAAIIGYRDQAAASATAAAASAAAALSSQTSASSSEASATSSASAASASAAAAAASESSALTSASAASTSASTASSAASSASSSASSASSSASAAASSESSAAASAAAAAAFQGVSFKNKIINGKMEIAQRGASISPLGAGSAYTLDRFRWIAAGSVGATATQAADAPANAGLQYSLRVTINTADVSIGATDLVYLDQPIEGYNVSDLVGKTFTLSFWVRSPKVGTHCVFLSNSTADRSYVAEYTVAAANTWEFKTVTLVGGLPVAGTWNFTSGVGLQVGWALASGSNFNTTAGAWQTGAYRGTANQVNCVDTVGNIFAITGVLLEVGSVATPFEHRPIGTELALCQRYYEVSDGDSLWSGDITNGGRYYLGVRFMTQKRSSATVSVTDQSNGGFPAGAPGVSVSRADGFWADKYANVSSVGYFQFKWTASAEL